MRGRPAAEEALRAANTLLLPLLRAARRIAYLAASEARLPPGSGVKLHQTGDRRIHIAIIDLPYSRPMLVGVYVSTQESRPVSPSQVRRRLERLAHVVKKLQGKLYTQADIIYVYVSKTRLTKTAYYVARSMGSLVALSPRQAATLIANRIKWRIESIKKLLKKRSSRILSLVASSLEILANTLSTDKIPEEGPTHNVLSFYSVMKPRS